VRKRKGGNSFPSNYPLLGSPKPLALDARCKSGGTTFLMAIRVPSMELHGLASLFSGGGGMYFIHNHRASGFLA
jgi:hypothetical protein